MAYPGAKLGILSPEVIAMSKESAYFQLATVGGKRDSKKLKQELDQFPGVISVSVNPRANTVAVDYDTTGVTSHQLSGRLEKLGCRVESCQVETHEM